MDKLIEDAWHEGKPHYSGLIAQLMRMRGFKLEVMIQNGETTLKVI